MSAELSAASSADCYAAPRTPPSQSEVAVPRSSAVLAADVLARVGDDGDAAARLVEQQATLVSPAGSACLGHAGLGDAASRCAGMSVCLGVAGVRGSCLSVYEYLGNDLFICLSIKIHIYPLVCLQKLDTHLTDHTRSR